MFGVALAQVTEQREALGRLVAGVEPEAVPLDEAPALWAAFDGIERLAAAAKTLLARRVDESGVWQREGHRHPADYLAQRSGCSRGVARGSLATSRRLSRLPHTEQAVRRGELSRSQAEAIADAAAANPDAEQALVEAAGRLSFAELRDECQRRKAAADPDPDATHERLRRERRLRRFTDSEGAWNLVARGTPEAGAFLNTVLDPIIDELFRAARGETDREPHEATAFDALVELAHRARTAAAGYHASEPAAGYHPPGNAGTAAARGHADPGPAGAGGTRSGARGDSEPGAGHPSHADTDRAGAGLRPDDTSDTDHSAGGHSPADGGRTPPSVPGGIADVPATGGERDPGALGGDADAGSDPGETGTRTAGGPEPLTSVPAPVVGDPAAAGVPGRAGRFRTDRVNPTYLALLRVDLTALTRGAVDGDELVEIHGVGPVPVTTARELLGDAVLKLVITRGADVLNVTHLGRGPTAAQRIALLWQSPGCIVEGCPNRWVEIDHRIPWAETRHTRLDELDRPCTFHHRLKTFHGWELVPGTGRRPMVAPGDPRHPGNQQRPRPPTGYGGASAGPETTDTGPPRILDNSIAS